MKKKIISVVGARPNFIKIAPIHKAFLKFEDKIEHLICHTGQHFDEKMSKIFFQELEMPKPDFYLGIKGGSHAEQTAKIMIAFEKVLLEHKPDLVIVPGDVNSTLAASLTASKLHIPIAHVEAGLRSFDMNMPEEINRILTDKLSDLLFITEKSAKDNLQNEGTNSSKIFFTGNVMIDSLVYYLPKINNSKITSKLHLNSKEYILSTFHRPSNVDNYNTLKKILETFSELAKSHKIVFPVHPRTRNKIKTFKLEGLIHENILLLEPVGYLDFLSLMKNASLVITDSGGIQEETTFLDVQCITVRETTERPITCSLGTNQLIGTNYKDMYNTALATLSGNIKKGKIPELWDGHAAERICSTIIDYIK
jgi:UDP-N-acetylglucosamine 2-epimerase (non-hydrolysing)